VNRDERVQLISQIERQTGGKVLVFFTGDRPPLGSRIAEDAVRPLYEHLLNLDGQKPRRKICLFLYSRGGDVSVPWRFVTMIREFCDEFDVLVPYKAHSAATMIAIGADHIVMGRKAELSPIDPTMTKAASGASGVPPSEISVEDVSSYISFMRDRANITDQAAMGQLVSLLANYLTPLALGSVNRNYSHIRLVARKLLTSRKRKIEEDRIATIIEALTEKMYSHGHAIGRQEAKELGLPVVLPKTDLEESLWKLYLAYETALDLNEPLDPEVVLDQKQSDSERMEALPLAIIETAGMCHVFRLNLNMRRKRNVPANPQVNINLNFGLPPGIDPASLPKDFQATLQQILAGVSERIPEIVRKEIARQSPVVGAEMNTSGGRWVKE
jgi:hypothetical protein